jgi:metal-dependent amidase/aminoacylase/carboxypeptidase family protein
MIDDGLFDRFSKPEVVLGQHVMVGPAGTVAGHSLQIRLFGRGAAISSATAPRPGMPS